MPFFFELQSLMIFIIDILLLTCTAKFGFLVAAGCKDIDDALHCTASPDGNFEVGVRILELLTFILDIVDSSEFTAMATKRETLKLEFLPLR